MKIAKIIAHINPLKAYIAIPVRPPDIRSVEAPEVEKLNEAWQLFKSMNIETEFLTLFEGNIPGYTGNIIEDILNITAVHPLREDSLIKLINDDNSDAQVIKYLLGQRLIKETTYNGNKYYLRAYHTDL